MADPRRNGVTLQWVLGILVTITMGVSGYTVHLAAKVADDAQAATEKKVDKDVFMRHQQQIDDSIKELRKGQDDIKNYLIEKLGQPRIRERTDHLRGPR